MDSVREPRPELESLVPYDAKDVRADVTLQPDVQRVSDEGAARAKSPRKRRRAE